MSQEMVIPRRVYHLLNVDTFQNVTFTTTRKGRGGGRKTGKGKNLQHGGRRITRMKEHERMCKEILRRKQGNTRDGK